MPEAAPASWKRPVWYATAAVVALVGCLALPLLMIAFTGHRDWLKTKADLLARGEKLTIAELAPRSIPDDQNFFGDPMWKEVSDTVATVSSYGYRTRRPRLPDGQRQLDAFDPDLSPEWLDRARKLLPPKPFQSKVPSRWSEIPAAVRREFKDVSDPTKRREIAQLTLDALAPTAPLRERIELLLTRPGAVFPIDYTEGFSAYVGQVLYINKIGSIYNQLSRAQLALGESSDAAQNIDSAIRVANTLAGEPNRLMLIIRVGNLASAASVIDEGIVQHAWDDSELLLFSRTLAGIDLLPQLASALRGERGSVNSYIENGTVNRYIEMSAEMNWAQSPADPLQSALYPICKELDQSYFNRYQQQKIDLLCGPSGARPADLPAIPGNYLLFLITHPVTAAAAAVSQDFLSRILAWQSLLLQARIACALERYWLKNQAYPASLDLLVPEFLSAIPHDVIASQPFRYRKNADGTFLLWSVGWNETDEGGVADWPLNYTTKDWVWNQSVPRKR
jgi:hypothetical protein